MRKIILITVILIANVASAQNTHDLMNNFFRNDKNVLEWRVIRDTDLSRTELIDAVIESGFFEQVEVTGNMIVCEFRPYKMNYDQYGLSVFESSTIISQNLIAGTVVFEIKGNRYRSVVKNIRFILNTEEAQGVELPFEVAVFNRQQDMRFTLFKNISEILDKDFSNKTRFTKKDADWE